LGEVKLKIENSAQLSTEDKKEEFICAILSLILAVIILAGINYLIFLVYKPNIDEIVQYAASISIMDKSLFAPEPVERVQYIVSVVLSPFVVFVSCYGVKKILKKISFFPKKIELIYLTEVIGTTICIISLGYFINIQDNFFYFKNTIVFDNFPLFVLLLFPIILFFLLLTEKRASFNKLFSIILTICSFILIGMLFFMAIFNKNLYYGSIPHFDAVFYSVAQVVSGKTLLVDFNNQYGLYPHFLDPIFKIIGLSVVKFSIIMSLLTTISVTSIFFFLKKTVSNNVISFLGFTTIIFFSILGLITVDIYFQYWPIRTIFPAIFILLAALYLKEENQIIYYILCVLSSIAILWNIDSGVIIFLSWGLLLGYCELFQQNIRKTIINWGYHFFTIITIFCAIFCGYILFIFVRSGSFPNFFEFIEYQQFFYISGFYMIPMSLFHPWNAIIIIYIGGLLYASKSIINGDNSYIAKVIFLLTVLGFGLFSYYQGRSHDVVLPLVSYPAILLLTIFTDISLSNLKKYGRLLYHNFLMVVLFIFILSISICSIGYNLNEYYQFSERGFSSLNESQPTNISENINFIKTSTSSGEKILILADNYNGVYYAESHTVSILNEPSFAEMLYIKDYDRIKKFLLNNSEVKVFVDLSYYNPEFDEILNQNYSIKSISTTSQMALLYRDTTKLNQFIFKKESDSVYHRNSDIIYPQEKIRLNTNFTVQILVKPAAIQVPYAAIIGNHPGYNNFEGFVIQQDNTHQNEYTFTFGNGKSWESPVKFHLNENTWNYFVVTVDARKVSVYKNGVLIESTNVNSTIKNSEMPLYIRNWINYNRQFNGTIKEVMITNSSILPETIKSNWKSIQNIL
jgi:hypothetical protein